MKGIAIILVLLCLVLAQAGHAADLQAGWYVNINGLNVFTNDPITGLPDILNEGEFYQTPPDQYGPFQVSDLVNGYHVNAARFISVPTTVLGAGPDQSLTLPVTVGLVAGTGVDDIQISWATNYDTSQMYLGLYDAYTNGTVQCLWIQNVSGVQGNNTNVAYGTTFGGNYYFAVNVVPEPSSMAFLLFGCIYVLCITKESSIIKGISLPRIVL